MDKKLHSIALIDCNYLFITSNSYLVQLIDMSKRGLKVYPNIWLAILDKGALSWIKQRAEKHGRNLF